MNSAYSASKLGLSALTRIQQRRFDIDGKGISINHVHPGYVDTDMTSHKGTSSVQDGARSTIFAALLPDNKIKGQFIWEDCSIKDWVNGE